MAETSSPDGNGSRHGKGGAGSPGRSTRLSKAGVLVVVIFGPHGSRAGILTNGSFSRDEWNHLLRLFKRRHRMKALRWRKRDHTWWRATRGVKKSLHKVWDLWSVRGNTDERKEVEIAVGNSMRSASRSEVGYSQAS